MHKNPKKSLAFEFKLYNKILILSRNKLLYSKLDLHDNFTNRIYLIFLHIAFLFIKIKINGYNRFLKEFSQRTFDITFNKIEENMREIGYGDTSINNHMKILVKNFYNILLFCEKYDEKTVSKKNSFLSKYLTLNNHKKHDNNADIVRYFDKYYAFCLDLSSDNVLKGEINFTYN